MHWWLFALMACSTPEQKQQNVLAGADSVDGQVDKVVHKCAGCGLGMDGKKEHAVQKDGYELHFCSDTCKTNFEEDPEAGVRRMKEAVDYLHKR